ncbi:hypothetical protein WEI85_17115 [Actinomycetes bacterium KLBMP 9797]
MRALVPLRVPAGWLVEYNTFVEFRPDRPPTVDDYLWHHTEDLLQIRSCKVVDGAWQVDPDGFLVDLGWYPDGEPTGAYRLVVVRPDFRGDTVIEVSHRKQSVIRQAIETCIAGITNGAAVSAIAEEVRDVISR